MSTLAADLTTAQIRAITKMYRHYGTVELANKLGEVGTMHAGERRIFLREVELRLLRLADVEKVIR